MTGTPTPLDRRLRELLDRGQAAGDTPIHRGTVEDARQRVRAGNALCAAGPAVPRVVESRLGTTRLLSRLYVPARPDPLGVLVYFHGGGWVTGDLDYSDNLCRYLAVHAGVEVVSVDYRLAPEARFPLPVDDAVAAVKAVAGQACRTPVGVGGDSAGGNLAAAAAATLRGTVDLAAQVLVYPVLDHDTERASYRRSSGADGIGTDEMRWFMDHYCPDVESRRDRRFTALSDDLAGMPSTVLLVAGHDPLRDEGVDHADRLREAGIPVELIDHPSMNHGFFRFEAVLGDYVATAASELASAVATAFELRLSGAR